MSTLEELRKQVAELEKDMPPINRERSFSIKIEDKYQRSYLDYDGIKKMEFRFGGKGSRSEMVVLPAEDIEKVCEIVAPLKEYAEAYGFDTTYGHPRHQVTYAPSQYDSSKYLDDDSKAVTMAVSIETYLFERFPAMREMYDESVRGVTQKEQEAAAEKQRMFDELSLDTLRQKYPTLFDENGDFTKEGIQLIMNLIDNHAAHLGRVN